MNVPPLLRDGIFVEFTAVGDTDNGANCDATWRGVMTEKKECEAVVLPIFDTSDSEPIAIACHCVWKTKKNAAKLKPVNTSIEDIEAKKGS